MKVYENRRALVAERALYGRSPWLLQPSYWAVRVYRYGAATRRASGPFRLMHHAVYFGLYSGVRLVTGIDIPRSVEIGARLMIHHFGGVIIHPQAKIGSDCVLRHGVTIGERHEGGGVPIIGDGVVFGAYAQVLGPVRVGDRAKIGALSVVMREIPDGATVVGIPGRVL